MNLFGVGLRMSEALGLRRGPSEGLCFGLGFIGFIGFIGFRV